MKKQITILILALSCACGLFEDDTPGNDSAPFETGDANVDCEAVITSALAQDHCDAPYAPTLLQSIQGSTILWIDDPENDLGVGGGAILSLNTSADYIAYARTGDQSCEFACVLSPDHPCSQDGINFCQYEEPGGQMCTMCQFDLSDNACGLFQLACMGDDPYPSDNGGGGSSGGGNDGTSTGGGGTSTGAGTSTGGGDVAPPPVIDPCKDWNPSAAISGWLDEPIVDKVAFTDIITDAELLLGQCDNLRLALSTDGGITLTSVELGTFAAGLGLEQGDELRSLNDVSASDLLGLTNEIIRLSQSQQPEIGMLVIRRLGVEQTIRVRIQ